MFDEGYVKFKCHHDTVEWNNQRLPLNQELEYQLNKLDTLRTELFDARFIGMYQNGIGYGNISLRYTENNSKNQNDTDNITHHTSANANEHLNSNSINSNEPTISSSRQPLQVEQENWGSMDIALYQNSILRPTQYGVLGLCPPAPKP